MIVLIPAYEPDARLVRLVRSLLAADGHEGVEHVVVVDDGSGPRYAEWFSDCAALGATVLHTPENRGKGHALKSGFTHVEAAHPGAAVVCADCDGQHSPADIVAVGHVAEECPGVLVLGSRRFTGDVPAKSMFGNTMTRMVFARSTGRPVFDTQTGLRAYSADVLPWLATVPGERFDYELDVLLRAGHAGYPIREVPIETIYLDGNSSSHFRPVVDSARVYAPILRFSASSLAAFAVDVVALEAVYAATGNLLASVVSARAISSTVNFTTNRRLVFRHGRRSARASALRYFGLVIALLTANYGLMHLLHEVVGAGLLTSKLVTEVTLFVTSYQVQRRVVFGGPPEPSAEPVESSGPAPADALADAA